MDKIVLSWSGGKDSSLSLYAIEHGGKYEIDSLITTTTEGHDRINIHAVRLDVLKRQAEAIGLPVRYVRLPERPSNDEYNKRFNDVLKECVAERITNVAYGDIFLEDLMDYRKENLAKVGMTGYFPLWKKDTKELAKKFIDLGFRAIITCIDTRVLDGSLAGREFDYQFLNGLPENVDACGENGEFHTFVYDGPIFKNKLSIQKGEAFKDERFSYCDIMAI